MCEPRALDIRWPQWHTFVFEEQVAVDMRVVCMQDGKVMLLKQAWMACWKRRAAKHECEELKLEPVQAVLRRKTNEAWTDRHRHVTRKLVVEGGWVQQGQNNIGGSDEKKCRGCYREEGTETLRLCHCLSHGGTSGTRSQQD